MPNQVLHRRGTEAQHTSFTGGTGEITYVTDNKFVTIHDSSQLGGFIIPKLTANKRTLDLNGILYANSTTTLTTSSSFTWDGSTFTIGTLTGMIKGSSGALSAVTGATNRVTFWSDSNTISSDANLTWDGSQVTIIRTGAGLQSSLVLRNAQAAAADVGPYQEFQGASSVTMGAVYTAWNGAATTDSYLAFRTRGSDSLSEKWRITSAGILQSNGAQTIQTSSGVLTVQPAGDTLLASTSGKVGIGSAASAVSAYTVLQVGPSSGAGGTGGMLSIVAGGTTQGYVYGDGGASGLRLQSTTGKTIIFETGGGNTRFTISDSASTLTGTGTTTFATTSNGNILLSPNGTGDVLPGADNTTDFGASATRWATGYFVNLNSGASNLSVTTGSFLLSYLTQKSVLFAGASGAVSQNASSLFQWDDTNLTLGVGIAATATDNIYSRRTGTVTTSQSGLTVVNTTTNSTTAGLIRYGMYLSTSGTWTGGGNGIVYGIFIDGATGGNTNWALYNNSGSNVYLGTGSVGINKTSLTYRLEVDGRTLLTNTANAFHLGFVNGGSTLWIGANGSGGDLQWSDTSGTALGVLAQNGRVGIATTSPSYILSFGGNSARTIGMERHTTADTAGNSLTVEAGGATSGATNKAGGTTIIRGGQNTGSGNSVIEFYTCAAGGAATTDGTQTLRVTIDDGIQVGAPTGGDKGSGTINVAGDIYKNNTAYTNPDYVFERAYKGEITIYKDNPGANEYKGRLSISELKDYTKQHYRLPLIKGSPAGIFERGDVLLAALEEAYLYIFELEDRVSKLEKN